MEEYIKTLKSQMLWDIFGYVLIFLGAIIAVLYIVRIANKYDEGKGFNIIIWCVYFALVVIGVFIMYFAEIRKPLMDIKENSFVTYVGRIENIVHHEKYNDSRYKLIDKGALIVEDTSGALEPTIKNCKAKIVYGEHSKQVVDFELID